MNRRRQASSGPRAADQAKRMHRRESDPQFRIAKRDFEQGHRMLATAGTQHTDGRRAHLTVRVPKGRQTGSSSGARVSTRQKLVDRA